MSTFSMNSIVNYFFMVLLTFLKKKMLNSWITLVVNFVHFLLFTLDVNFSHNIIFLKLTPTHEMKIIKCRFYSNWNF